MAAPADMTTKNISGKYTMNKTITDIKKTDEILRQQGVSWTKRTAIYYATISLTVKHYTDDDGVEHIDIDQALTGGIGSTKELRTLDWVEREHEDHIFGKVAGKSRRVKLSDLESEKAEEFLIKDWTEDVGEQGTVHGIVRNEAIGWTAEQTWGFQVIDGKRYYTRHVYFTHTGDEPIRATLVYDYTGPIDG